MEVQCENCGKIYRIDEGKIKGRSARFKCVACNGIITVEKPASKVEDTADYRSVATSSSQMSRMNANRARQHDSKSPEANNIGLDTETKSAPKKIRFGLFFKIIILMLVVSLFPLGAYWTITFRASTDRVRESTENLMAQPLWVSAIR